MPSSTSGEPVRRPWTPASRITWRSWGRRTGDAGSGSYPLALRVEQRVGRHVPRHPPPEDLGLDRRPRVGIAGGQVGVRDRPLDGVAVPSTGDAAHDLSVDPHGLLAQGHRMRIVENQAPEDVAKGMRLRLEQRVPAKEVTLVELD